MRLTTCIIGLTCVTALAASAPAAETVRIEVASGAPRILVDGKPVRARIFWGGPGSRSLPIGPQTQALSFEFTPTEDEPAHATMHLRFGHIPGDIYLDDIHVVDLNTGADVIPICNFDGGQADFTRNWIIYPPGDTNTVATVEVVPKGGKDNSAALHVALKAPPDGNWPDFHIYHRPCLSLNKEHRYCVTLWVRSTPERDLAVAFYRPGHTFVFLGGPENGFTDQIKMAAAAGVDLVSFPIGMPWPQPDESVDWSSVDAACRRVLKANPKALLLPRFGMEPPAWWQKANPEEMMVWDKSIRPSGAVVGSPKYRHDAAQRLEALVSHLEQQFGPHMAGYHPCGQNTGEWFYQDTWGPALNGYSKGTERAFRSWLKQQYPTDAALQSAWRDPNATLQSATVPTPAARREAPAGTLCDPTAQCAVIDFARFQQQAMADCVCHFAHTVRQATHGRNLVTFFYGYVFEFAAVRNGPATAGHYALRRLLECPDIDLLCSPISYFDRGLGQSAPAMTAAESIALAGKMWLYEDDTRTYLGTGKFPGWRDRVDTIEDTNAELVRNTAQCALRNLATWWMDLGMSGWFNDPRMWAEMKRLNALDQPLLEHPLAFQPSVAAVIDEPSMIRTSFNGYLATSPGVYQVRCPLGRMGAPYGQYLLDDVTAGRVPAKLYVMLTAWYLSPQQRRQLLDATRGTVRIWCYAPGYLQAQGASFDAMAELTGFRIKEVSPPKTLAEPTASGKALGLTQAFGADASVRPLFAAADATPEETLATYSDGSPAVALRHTSDGWSLFVGPPGLTSELLRLAARKAGVHLFTQTDCNVYANGPYLVIHTAEDGPLQIDTGHAAPVRDLLSGQSLGRGPNLTLDLGRGQTRVLQIQ